MDQIQFADNLTSITLPVVLRIGMTPSMPWMFLKTNGTPGHYEKDSKGNFIFEGYCVDLLAEMSKVHKSNRAQIQTLQIIHSRFKESQF